MRNNYWSNYSKKAPKKWKFIEQFIYSNEVNIIDDTSYPTAILGKMEIKYKIVDNEIDMEYMKNMFTEMFGRDITWNSYSFQRDRGLRPYITDIYLTDIEFKRIKREQKLERLLK